MGAKPDDGGINPQNLQAMQSLFQNESVGRVLVSDYTTKADFIIPDINKVLGAEKYKVVNEDIRDGLQNVIVGQEKYANTEVKAQIFLERLKEARNAFLNDFLQPQIKILCRSMGFRKFPFAKFQDIDIKDEVQLQRVATRLIELGILPAEEGLKTIQTGVYPSSEDLVKSQERYTEQRKQGMYNPLVGGVPSIPAPEAESTEAAPVQQKTPNETGRPLGAKANYESSQIQATVYEIEDFKKFLSASLKKERNVKRVSKKQNEMLDSLVESIICSEEKSEWKDVGLACIKDFKNIEKLNHKNEISEISEAHELGVYPSAILYHSKK